MIDIPIQRFSMPILLAAAERESNARVFWVLISLLRLSFTPPLLARCSYAQKPMRNRLNGNNILDSSDLRPSCGLVLCSCFFVVCFADESTGTKPRNHTNQESRKDTKGQLMSQVYYYP